MIGYVTFLKVAVNLLHTHSRGEHGVGRGVVGPWASGAPLQGVDITAVLSEVVEPRLRLHTPDLGCVVVGARGQEGSGWIPFHCIDPILYGMWMALMCLFF